MTADQLPPGPARRARMDAAGRNVGPCDFTAEELATMAAETEAAREFRSSHTPTLFPGVEPGELDRFAS